MFTVTALGFVELTNQSFFVIGVLSLENPPHIFVQSVIKLGQDLIKTMSYSVISNNRKKQTKAGLNQSCTSEQEIPHALQSLGPKGALLI